MRPLKKNQPGSALWGVLIGLGLAIAIAACAAGRSAQPAASGPSVAGVDAGIDPRKQEIMRLSKEIRQWRVGQDMAPEPPIDLTQRPEFIQPPVKKLRQCQGEEDPPKTAECTDVCTLKDDICDNAESICRIADELGDDAWAQEKCKSAKASCKEATEKCCGCLADE